MQQIGSEESDFKRCISVPNSNFLIEGEYALAQADISESEESEEKISLNRQKTSKTSRRIAKQKDTHRIKNHVRADKKEDSDNESDNE